MIVKHSIEIIAKVDGTQIHSDTFNVTADSPLGDAMANFDARTAIVAFLRLEANLIEQEAQRDARRQELNGNWIDADAGPLPATGD